MATNLRLDAAAQQALRERAAESGRSQQDLLRSAVDQYLGLGVAASNAGDAAGLIAAGRLRPPRLPYRRVTRRLRLDAGTTSSSLLDRDDRI